MIKSSKIGFFGFLESLIYKRIKYMKKTIITYGTFDMFHIGHLKLLQRLKSLGDELIVAVSSDEFNRGKGKKVMIPYT